MGANRVVRFEFPASRPEALARFLSDLFGWIYQCVRTGAAECWAFTTGSRQLGINGGVVKRQNPQHPPMTCVDVASADVSIERATQLGARVALPKTPIPGVGAISCLRDPGGNVFDLIEQSRG